MPLVSDDKLKQIIVEGDNEVLVDQARAVGEALARQLTSSQIRGIFGSVRRIELDWQEAELDADKGASKAAGDATKKGERIKRAQREIALLQPRLAYQARRERGRGVEELSAVLTPALRLIGRDHDRFRNFVDFFEAILAYHRAAGGQ